MRRQLPLLLVPVALGLGACNTLQQPDPFVGWFEEFATCRDEYAAFDAKVEAAGVTDAAYYRIPGFPYLRTDRTIASFAHEVETREETWGWILRMREFDREAREFEFRNLGMPMQEIGIQRDRFLRCSNALAGIELEDPAMLEKVKALAQPPDEYSGTARALGLYPLMKPLLRSRIEEHREQVRREFARPIEELDGSGPLYLWTVQPTQDPEMAQVDFAKAFPDELGFPGLVESQWQALAEKHAPQLWIETGGEQDRPGTPVWTEHGVDVDLDRAVIHYTISFARFGELRMPQITYFTWFRGRGPEAPIDSTIWRVNLDRQGRPLAYESLHGSGHSHYWFPVQELRVKPAGAQPEQSAFLPQDRVPEGRPTLRMGAGSHALRRVLNGREASAEHTGRYTLERYEELYNLALPDGGTRSLFDPDGVVPGTGGEDPLWMWASGVKNPGAIKQYGHQTPAYIGRAHFDEPFLLESVFEVPGSRGS